MNVLCHTEDRRYVSEEWWVYRFRPLRVEEIGLGGRFMITENDVVEVGAG